MPIGNLFLGLYNAIQGSDALSKLHKEKFPVFGATTELLASKARADEMAKYGYSPDETNAFKQSLAQKNNTAYLKATALAPGLSQQVLSGINYGDINALNQFAASDAELHRKNITYSDKFSAYLQELNNQNVEEQIKSRRLAEEAYGNAVKTGTEQIAGHFNQDEADAKSMASSVGGMFLGGI